LAGGQIFLATRAYKSGNPDKGSTQLAEAVGNAHQALAKQDRAAIRILAASFVLHADRFPEEQKMALLKEGRDLFAIVRKQEDAMLDQMPEHLKGELLAGQAQAAMRLGLQEEATKYLNEIVARLPNTHYSATAQKWLAEPASAAKSQLVCQSCHEPNRLANRLKAVAAK
jgi:urease accessory protein UreF